MRAHLLVLVGCTATDGTGPDAGNDTDDTDAVGPPGIITIEWDAQGVACLSGAGGGGFGAGEPLTITVDLACVDPCNMESFETRCSTSLFTNLLAVSSHGHVVYYEEPTTTCAGTCMDLVAECTYAAGLSEGEWSLSYSATVTGFTVPSPGVVCAADTDDT